MPTTAPKPPLDPSAPARGALPLWLQAIASAAIHGPKDPAWRAALETAPTPGMIEFPAAARQFTDPRAAAFIRHIMELAGEFGESGGGSSMRQLKSALPGWVPSPLKSLPRFVGEEATGVAGDIAQPFRTAMSPRLQARLSPTRGAEADAESSALLKLLLNPVFYNRFYRGPFPK